MNKTFGENFKGVWTNTSFLNIQDTLSGVSSLLNSVKKIIDTKDENMDLSVDSNMITSMFTLYLYNNIVYTLLTFLCTFIAALGSTNSIFSVLLSGVLTFVIAAVSCVIGSVIITSLLYLLCKKNMQLSKTVYIVIGVLCMLSCIGAVLSTLNAVSSLLFSLVALLGKGSIITIVKSLLGILSYLVQFVVIARLIKGIASAKSSVDVNNSVQNSNFEDIDNSVVQNNGSFNSSQFGGYTENTTLNNSVPNGNSFRTDNSFGMVAQEEKVVEEVQHTRFENNNVEKPIKTMKYNYEKPNIAHKEAEKIETHKKNIQGQNEPNIVSREPVNEIETKVEQSKTDTSGNKNSSNKYANKYAKPSDM